MKLIEFKKRINSYKSYAFSFKESEFFASNPPNLVFMINTSKSTEEESKLFIKLEPLRFFTVLRSEVLPWAAYNTGLFNG